MRGMWHQSGQFFRVHDVTDHGLHLDPMTEQHVVDQSYEFPEEVVTGKTGHRRHAINVSGGDGDADQRHHARIAITKLLPQPIEKWPAAVEVDDTGQSGQNVSIACKTPPLAQAQRVLNHRREGKNRDCQKQADPEPLPEISHHLAVIVPGMIAVIGMQAMIIILTHVPLGNAVVTVTARAPAVLFRLRFVIGPRGVVYTKHTNKQDDCWDRCCYSGALGIKRISSPK